MAPVGERFRKLHESGIFLMPNPWDVGSAQRLESMGFPALATTSSGHAASMGKQDREVTLDELVDHVDRMGAAVDVPISVDLEWGFVARIVALGAPVNVLALPGTPPVAELAALGVRRISTGGALAYVAYKAAEVAAAELRDEGTPGYFARM